MSVMLIFFIRIKYSTYANCCLIHKLETNQQVDGHCVAGVLVHGCPILTNFSESLDLYLDIHIGDALNRINSEKKDDASTFHTTGDV